MDLRRWPFIAEDLKPLGAIAEDPCVVGRLKKIGRKIVSEKRSNKDLLVLIPITQDPNDYNVDIGPLTQS